MECSLLKKLSLVELLTIIVGLIGVFQYLSSSKGETEIEPQIAENASLIFNEVEKLKKPKYWFYTSDNDLIIFTTVDVVLSRLGLEKTSMNASSRETTHNEWDLLWSYEHHQTIPFNWSQVKYHQKVNHIPGSFHLTSKSVLGSRTVSKYVPKAFLNVEDVKRHLQSHPNKRFVVKLKSNRGVSLQNVSDMNFTNTNSQKDFFAMEFVENPLLFNGHKFDFAVYVVITSVNPLRLYYYNKNIIMRFCPKTYDTSDPEDRDRYVVQSTHIPGSKFQGIKEYFNNGFTYKEGFNAFLEKMGQGTSAKVWSEVENLIRSTVLSKEGFFKREIESSGISKYSVFEMYRFDMILDRDLNLYVLEINQSPNIYPGERYINNKHVYESVLFNLFNLLGIGKNYKNENFKFDSMNEESMVVHRNSLTVKAEICMKLPCNQTCFSQCELCFNCLTQDQRYDLQLAYMEQMDSGEMKRLFPPSKDFVENSGEDFWNSMLPESKLHVKWFHEMCQKDKKFC